MVNEAILNNQMFQQRVLMKRTDARIILAFIDSGLFCSPNLHFWPNIKHVLILGEIANSGVKMETGCPLRIAVVFQLIKKELSQRFQENARPPIDRLLCTKSINLHALQAAIGPKSNVKWFKM
ncbi:hypothetical protein ACFL3F_03320 [Planctomycetota bacterium]